MANYIVPDSELSSVADAIRNKAGISELLEFPNDFIDTIENISTGPDIEIEALSITQNGTYTAPSGKAYSPVNVNVQGGSVGVSSKDVNFIDYDGTIVYSYTAAEFAELSVMPNNPSHEGLIAQGWNWSLSDAKSYVADYGQLEIGQIYITDDGKTRVYIHLEKDRTSPMLGVCPNGTVDVDWGDGTNHDILTGTDTKTVKWTQNHNYAAPGDYIIKLTVTGSMGFLGSNSFNLGSGLLRYSASEDGRNRSYLIAIKKIEIGNHVTVIGNCAFRSLYALSSITIPMGIASIEDEALFSCYSIKNVNIPDGITSIGNSAFKFCYGTSSITIPKNVTTIGNEALSNDYNIRRVNIPDGTISIGNSVFSSCFGISRIIIPKNVTSIGGTAFFNCYGVVEFHITSTAPPILSSTNALSGITSDWIIYVPYSEDHSILNAYKTATNWSTYASYMQEEPQ